MIFPSNDYCGPVDGSCSEANEKKVNVFAYLTLQFDPLSIIYKN